LLGGRVALESELGKGSTFTLTFNHQMRSSAELAQWPDRHGTCLNFPETSLREQDEMVPAQILIIEDNDVNRGLMSYLLPEFGHTTIEAKDGVAGLAIAQPQPCDLVLSDVYLPKLDGFDIVKEPKKDKSLRAIPVVAEFAAHWSHPVTDSCLI
jgi:PleD family two-component response regulator